MTFLSFLISGISLGSIYAIIALGYTMVYGIAKMLNFAHGDVIMVGAYICFYATSRFELPAIAGVLLAIVVGGELFGIPGMVAGVPTLAVLAALARQAVGAGLTARGLPEEPPPAPQEKTVTKKAKN